MRHRSVRVFVYVSRIAVRVRMLVMRVIVRVLMGVSNLLMSVSVSVFMLCHVEISSLGCQKFRTAKFKICLVARAVHVIVAVFAGDLLDKAAGDQFSASFHTFFLLV